VHAQVTRRGFPRRPNIAHTAAHLALEHPVAPIDVLALAPRGLPADWGWGWGWLRPVGDSLEMIIKPIWHAVDGDQRLEFLHKIAMRATRSETSWQTPTARKLF